MKNMINWIIGANIEDKRDRMMHYFLMVWTVVGSISGIVTMIAM